MRHHQPPSGCIYAPSPACPSGYTSWGVLPPNNLAELVEPFPSLIRSQNQLAPARGMTQVLGSAGVGRCKAGSLLSPWLRAVHINSPRSCRPLCPELGHWAQPVGYGQARSSSHSPGTLTAPSPHPGLCHDLSVPSHIWAGFPGSHFREELPDRLGGEGRGSREASKTRASPHGLLWKPIKEPHRVFPKSQNARHSFFFNMQHGILYTD